MQNEVGVITSCGNCAEEIEDIGYWHGDDTYVCPLCYDALGRKWDRVKMKRRDQQS